MRNLLLTIAAMLVAGMVMSAAERKFEVMSPDATLKAEVVLGESVSYSVWKNNQKILDPSFVSMELSDGTFFGKGASLKKASRSKADNVLSAVLRISLTMQLPRAALSPQPGIWPRCWHLSVSVSIPSLPVALIMAAQSVFSSFTVKIHPWAVWARAVRNWAALRCSWQAMLPAM